MTLQNDQTIAFPFVITNILPKKKNGDSDWLGEEG
jgi:hypothetical protein